MNWKIIEILNQLKDAGLPEITSISLHNRPTCSGYVCYFETAGISLVYQSKIYIILDSREVTKKQQYEFERLPSAIQKLQELLTDKAETFKDIKGGGNE